MQMEVTKCLVISPGDLVADREAAVRAIEFWNAHNGLPRRSLLHPVRWETHSTPQFGGHPQDILNRQLVDSCECAIALFWSRLGTPTASYPSGSVEEIDRILEFGGKVLIYKCTRDFPQASLDPVQLARLASYIDSVKGRALVHEYSMIERLETRLAGHLTSVANEVSGFSLNRHLIAPKGLIIKTEFGLPSNMGSASPVILSVSCQNHSAQPIHMSGLVVELKNGMRLQPLNDFMGRNLNLQPDIPPGDAAPFFLDFKDLMEAAITDHTELQCVVVRDKLEREYSSENDDMKIAIANYEIWNRRKGKR